MTDQQRLRDDLLHRASIGEISGKEADDVAERLGLGRFSREPDPNVFNPLDERFWTLPMVIAWIAWRTPFAVRDAWYLYREQCWHWIWRRWRVGPDGDIQEGWHLEQRHRPNLGTVTLGAAFDTANADARTMLMPVSAAQDDLWTTMTEGTLKANAIDERSGTYVDIPALDWHQLVPTIGSDEADELRLGSLGRGYKHALFPARAIRLVWAPLVPERISLPAVMSPNAEGYMPLYCVAQWIATEGGAIDFNPEDEAIWRRAYTALCDAITTDKVRVVGTRDGLREPVPGYLFAGCRIEYPFRGVSSKLIYEPDLFLRSYPYLDEEHWHGGFHDSLVRRHEQLWTKLLLPKAEVRDLWPFGSATHKTGAPGRPTSMHLIEDELARRGLSGDIEPTLRKQSEVLVEWLKNKHPNSARPKPASVENGIRSQYHKLKSTK